MGFTLIETLLAIAILSMIVGISVPALGNLQPKNTLSVSQSVLLQSLHEAQLKSQAVENDSTWGVYVQAGSITLFQGVSYVGRNSDYDQVFDLSSSITPSGLSEVVFSKMYGYPNFTGTFTLTHGSSGLFNELNINEKGGIY